MPKNAFQILSTSKSLQSKTATDRVKRKDSTISNLNDENFCIETFVKKCSVREIIHKVLTFPVKNCQKMLKNEVRPLILTI